MKIRFLREIFIRPEGNHAPLDGLRAMAILLVLGAHTFEYYHKWGGAPTLWSSLPPFKGGWTGVPLFFVLSGYLIGRQIWVELHGTGRLNVWKFILRRGFRIWPLYYFVLLISALLLPSHYTADGFWSNLFFLSNYWSDSGPIVGAWSLATEEQFYILAPLLLLFSTRLFGSSTLAIHRKILIFLFFLPSFWRIFIWYGVHDFSSFDLAIFMKIIYRPIHTHCEGLIGGLILAHISVGEQKISEFFRNRRNLLALGALVLMIFSFYSKVAFNLLGVGLFYTSLVWLCLDDKRIVAKFFSAPFFFPIARLSFGIYLINVPIIEKLFELTFWSHIPAQWVLPAAFVVSVISCALLASALYLLIERPFLRIRSSLMK